jgi:hypothetical protein
MTITREDFDTVMDECLDSLTPLIRKLSKQEDVYASITIGVLLGAFLTTRKSREARDQAMSTVLEAIEHVQDLQAEIRSKMQ